MKTIGNTLAGVLDRGGRGFSRLARTLNPDLSCSSREARAKVQPGSLLDYAADVYSQRGDDGIIQEVFRRLGVERGFFVEFGAWDGLHHSNARLLFERGWSGMFIEADSVKAKHLAQRYSDSPDVICLHGMVFPTAGDGRKTLDTYCEKHGISEIDFLSIDIDGLDLNVLENLRLRPKLVAIEGGFSWHPQMSARVPDEVANKNLQQPLAVAVEAVRAKGYEPICFNQNLYAVEAEYAPRFAGIRQDAESLWLDAFYAQSEGFRSWLSDFRRSNALIRRHEAPYKAQFTLDV